MGYYTWHTLDADPQEDIIIPQCGHDNPEGATFCMACGKQIKNMSIMDFVWDYIVSAPEMDMVRYGVGEDGTGSERTKWYDHQKDMKVLSEKFPTVLFTLHGEGEEGGNLWKEYWLAGKVQVAKARIVYDEFSLSMLQEPKSN